MKNKFNGHEIVVEDGVAYFKDTDQPTIEAWKERANRTAKTAKQ